MVLSRKEPVYIGNCCLPRKTHSSMSLKYTLGLHNSCDISPTAGGTCQKCFTKHQVWKDAPECSGLNRGQFLADEKHVGLDRQKDAMESECFCSGGLCDSAFPGNDPEPWLSVATVATHSPLIELNWPNERKSLIANGNAALTSPPFNRPLF